MKTVIRAIATAVRRAPWAIVVATLVVVFSIAPLAGQVEVSQGNEGFSPDNPELLAAERVGELFGSEAQGSVIQVIIRSDSGDVFTKDAFDTVSAITESVLASDAASSLADSPDQPPVVSYLAPVQQAAQQGAPITDDASVKEFYLQALQSPEFAEQGAFVTNLISQDGVVEEARAGSGLMLIFLSAADGADGVEAFDAQIEAESVVANVVRSVDAPEGLEILPFSFSLLFEDQDDFISEVGRLFGFAALIILVILAFVFWLKPQGENASPLRSLRRTAADVGLTLFTIFSAIGLMQGFGYLMVEAGWIGSFNPVTQIIPILLIGLGVDYGIHITSRYREEVGEGSDADSGVRTAIGTVGVALTLATLTTVIGFLSNVFNPVPALKDFGILSALGIFISFGLMLTFVPAVRELLDRRGERRGTIPAQSMAAGGERVLSRIIERASILAERVPLATFIVALILGLLGVFGWSQLETRFSFTDFLPEDAPAVQTLEILQTEFGGGFGESTQVLVESDTGTLATAEFHNALVDVGGSLASVDNVITFDTPVGEVAAASSPITILQRLLQGGPEASPPGVLAAFQQVGLGQDLKAPAGTDVTPLWDALVEAAPEQAGGVMHRTESGDYSAVLVDLQTQAGETGASQLRLDLLDTFSPLADAGASTIATSAEIISNVIVQSLASSQTQSLLITLAIATVVLMVSFWFENRRPMLGVLTMFPVALVIFWTYGLMWATGIPFGPVTATLAALAVGIGVPFTIHIARRFEEDRNRFEDLEGALRSTMRHTGGALAGSAFTTMAGFGILITSSLTPFQQMGQVTVYAVGLSLVGAVLVLPSLLAMWEAWHRRRGDAIVEKETVSVV